MTRKQIQRKIDSNLEKISKIKLENVELNRKSLVTSDKCQQYYEKEVEVIVSKRPKVIENQFHGFIKWKEDFVDEDNGEVFSIERNQLVRVNNKWI